MNAKEVLKKLEKAGFYRKSQVGSHIKLTNGKSMVTVPYHGKKDLKIGTLKSIEKQSGIRLK